MESGDVGVDMTRVAAIALLCAVASLLFKQYKPDWCIPLRLASSLVLGCMILSAMGEIVGFVHSLGGDAVTEGMWSVLLKALGISFVTEVTSGICRDSGEGTLASWVEMVGKMTLLLQALPLIGEVLTTVGEFLNIGG